MVQSALGLPLSHQEGAQGLPRAVGATDAASSEPQKEGHCPPSQGSCLTQ